MLIKNPSLSLLLIFTLLIPAMCFGHSAQKSGFPKYFSGAYTQIDVNRIRAIITNTGTLFRHPLTGNAGLEWPKGSEKYLVYAAGLWIAGKVEDEIRLSYSEYFSLFTPGNLRIDSLSSSIDADSLYRVYKLIDQDTTLQDYQNWPYWLGAPVDSLGNPLVIGDQTLWCVFHDNDTTIRANLTPHSEPLLIEINQTVFGWSAYSTFLDDIIFIRWLIINRNNQPLDSIYLGIWADPDIWDPVDDKMGSDSLLSLGFAYNSSDLGNSMPPAVGFQILQGPIVSSMGDTANFKGEKVINHRNLPMTSFISPVIVEAPLTLNTFYNLLQGNWPDGSPITYGGNGHGDSGRITKYLFSGDPETGDGWLQPYTEDVKLLVNSGPFTMAPGDTQEVVWAVIAAQGTSSTNSVTLVKQRALLLQSLYENYLYKHLKWYNPPSTPPPPPPPQVIEEFELYQNYPNPFNAVTNIEYHIIKPGPVKLQIFDILGRRVATLYNGHQEAGTHLIQWDGRNHTSGIYFYRLDFNNGEFVKTRKMLLIK